MMETVKRFLGKLKVTNLYMDKDKKMKKGRTKCDAPVSMRVLKGEQSVMHQLDSMYILNSHRLQWSLILIHTLSRLC